MSIIKPSAQKILIGIARHVGGALTISTFEEIIKMSHVGMWKALKKLETEKIIVLKAIGNKKNSPYVININWDNPLTGKIIALALEHEAISQRRWIVNFAELEDKVDFLILYGSVLASEKKANDIDILSIISKKNISIEIENAIMKIQKTQIKPIHNIILSSSGLKDELNKPNIAFVNAVKDGVILFGQDKFVAFMQDMQK